ncbi:Uncharacterised protein [Mycobacterium tuberculosis]|nr:Uncharacterised protein [Mycobacterium tuberculosis]
MANSIVLSTTNSWASRPAAFDGGTKYMSIS